jgi:type IV secretory pathway VirB6-like protein
MSWVVGSVNALLDSLALLFVKAGGLPATSEVTSTWSLIDQYDAQVEAVVVALGKDVLSLSAPYINFPNLFAIVLISLGGCIFEVCVLAVACFARIVLTLALCLGPAFILTLLFQSTTKFFDAWLSKLLSAVMLSAITFFLAGLSLSITTSFLTSFLQEYLTINFVVAGMVVGVVEILLGIVMIQAPTLSAALVGGAIFQSGMGTISALVAGRGLRSGGAAASRPASGGSIGTSRGLITAHGMGRAVGMAGASARRLAYKLASLRGRT